MKIGEARDVYSARVNRLQNKRAELLKRKKEAEGSGDAELISAVNKEFDRIDKQCDTASKFMERFTLYTTAMYNREVSKKQSDAVKERFEDSSKCLEIARRISKGAKVPPEDIQKLMEYNRQLYMMAMMMAVMDKKKSDEEYDSLWDEEADPNSEMSAEEITDNMECTMEMPDSVMSDGGADGE